MAVSKVDAANQIENQLPQANIANNTRFRNIIINGDMSLAQRRTSKTGITVTGYYTVDRLKWVATTDDTVDLSQETDVPSGQGFTNSFKILVDTADTSIGANTTAHVQHRIEGQNLQYLRYGTSSAKTLTLSFWVKSNKTGTYCIALSKPDNTRYDYVAEYSISSSDTWEKKTLTIVPDSNIKASGGAIDNDNGSGFDLKFILATGSDRQGTNETWNTSTPADATSNQVNFLDSANNEFYLTGIQLEAGEVASDFEFLPFDVNLQRCQRYFYSTYNYGTSPGTITYDGVIQRFVDAGSNYASLQVFHPVPMRVNPSITIYNPNTGNTGSGTTDSDINRNMAVDKNNQKYVHLYANNTTISTSASIRCHITADAEL